MTELFKRDELKKLLAEEFETTQTAAIEIYDRVFAVLEDVVITQQKSVKLGEFGTLKVELKPAREHTNPQDPKGDKIPKSAHYGHKFAPSKSFKKELAEIPVQG
ncbi:HU family DNA-binding protein [Bacillus sp. FJAT-22090]|uniref:HU family DNA-binding protein n=1 Tax=Bacillus sp. FJAT-22090 TaxID=1581038 RepID=UPI0011A06C39|nr:HU family DNA-binding protein [Bacillus sp. FJAT-22090]